MTDERPQSATGEPTRPHGIWSPVVATLVVLLPGVLGLASGQLWLFPSLGPTAVMQAHEPRHTSSRIYNVIVSHLIGIGAGYVMVAAFRLGAQPSVFTMRSLTGPRVGAAAAAILIATVLELALNASHPPAASTTLLVALGSFKPNWQDVGWLIAGVFIVGIAGEIARRLRLRYQLGT